jgi:uncharacterized repeat protein (TIGR02543 family)
MVNMKKIFCLLVFEFAFLLFACNEEQQFRIEFDPNNGDESVFVTADTISHISFPENPTFEGHMFVGWFLEGGTGAQLYEDSLSNSLETQNVKVTAIWQKNNYSLIAYDNADYHFSFISSQGRRTLAISTTNKVFVWGDNFYPYIPGTNSGDVALEPIDITRYFNLTEEDRIIYVSSGVNHSLAISYLGNVYGWGHNGSGQVGNGTIIAVPTPTNITAMFGLQPDEKIIDVYAQNGISLALSSNGRVFEWGWCSDGESDEQTYIPHPTPIDITQRFQLAETDKIIWISTNGSRSFAYTSLGKVYAWGQNEVGQLGDGTIEYRFNPEEISSNFYLENDEYILDISIGDAHVIGLSSKGNVFGWGYNFSGQLASTLGSSFIPRNITANFQLLSGEKIIYIKAIGSRSYAITSLDRILAWGRNDDGYLGDGSTTTQIVPVDITPRFSLSTNERISEIIGGYDHTFLFTSEGKLFAWGLNDKGQIGDGTNTDRNIPLLVFSRSQNIEFMSSILIDSPTRDGYIFDGWYLDQNFNELFTLVTMPSWTVRLYAKWSYEGE